MAVGCVGSLQAEDFGVVLGLLEAFAGRRVCRLGLDDGNRSVGPVAQDIVSSLARTAATSSSHYDNTAVSERDLLVDAVGLRIPSRILEFGDNVSTASVCLIRHWVHSVQRQPEY